MFPLRCELHCYSAAAHLSLIYTGFGELARRHIVRVSATRLPGYSGKTYGVPARLRVRLNHAFDVIYDVSDSHVISRKIDLEEVDFCFKRSYRPDYLATVKHGHKVFPLGLNYPVFGSGDFGLRRAMWATSGTDCVKQIIRSTPLLARLFKVQGSIYSSHLQRFEGVPNAARDPIILFMAALWDPTRAQSPEKRDELWAMANMRAECVRQLKKEFGSRFVGGLFGSRFAGEHFKDCVLPSRNSSRKDSYLKLLDNASICVATAGLHGSIGSKVGEYVAGAKAIVSETLKCVLPGNFAAGRNYLEFTCPEQCVAAAAELVEDSRKRYEMMRANFLYYWCWARPDVLVLRTLLTVLAEAGKRADAETGTGDAPREFVRRRGCCTK